MHHETEIVPNPERPIDLATGGADAAVLSLPGAGLHGTGLLGETDTHPQHGAERTIKPAGVHNSSWSIRFPHGVEWPVAGWMLLMHVGAVAALWFFTWPAFICFVFLHWVTACLGITLGFHRLLTHGSLTVSRPVKLFFSMCGMLSAEGSPLMWVANHRKHHALSDQEGDPHTPNDGFWWSHMFWFYPNYTRAGLIAHYKRWAPDIYKDPVQRFLDRIFPLFSPLVGVALYAFGQYFFSQGWSFVMWGLCARMVACYHSTWFVNSATHVWGYRNYHTSDRSRNLWWVAVVSYGEGWHNNHHAHQRLAKHGHRWYEIDPTYMVIWTLKKTGLAWDVQDTLPTEYTVE
jgi:fatty-acid desaturase